MAPRHELEEEYCAGAADRELPNLVDDQDRRIRQDLQARMQASGGLRFLQRRDQIGECAVVDAPSALRGRDRQADGQVRLADTGWAEKITFSRRSTKPRSCKLSICSRRSEG